MDAIPIITEQTIVAPVPRVWQILTDFAGYPGWSSYVVRIDGEALAGSRIMVHSVAVPGMEPMVAPVEVVSVDPYVMHWEGGLPDRSRFKGDHRFRLEPLGADSARLVHEEYFTGSDAAAIIARHGAVIEAAFMRFNRDLAAVAPRS